MKKGLPLLSDGKYDQNEAQLHELEQSRYKILLPIQRLKVRNFEVEITQDGGEITVKPPLLKFNPFEGQWLVLSAITFKNMPFKYTVNLQLTYMLAVK
jgi:hypothetical protein